jgi:hypothetical protein
MRGVAALGAPTRSTPMRLAATGGAVASELDVASRGIASGCRMLEASLLRILIGNCVDAAAVTGVPAQPLLATAKAAKATNEMARSWLMAEGSLGDPFLLAQLVAT